MLGMFLNIFFDISKEPSLCVICTSGFKRKQIRKALKLINLRYITTKEVLKAQNNFKSADFDFLIAALLKIQAFSYKYYIILHRACLYVGVETKKHPRRLDSPRLGL
jgi:hypothetical protein